MGLGKSGLGFMIAKSAYAKNKVPAMFVCNRDSLVAQTVAKFKEYGFSRVARLQAGHYKMPDLHNAEVIVASLQTLVRVQTYPKISVLMADEVHQGWVSSEKGRSLIFHYAPTCPIIGLTATPFAKGMAKHYTEVDGPLFEKVIQPMKASEALELGYIVDCDIFAPVEIDMTGVTMKTKFGERDYDDSESANRSMKITGDVVSWWLRLANGTKTIAFTVNVDHAAQVSTAFINEGINTELIHGYMEAKQQQEIIGRYMRGETTMLVCPCLLGTGFDAPATETVIWARPTKSETTWRQYAGRGMRSSPGKERFTILDFAGTAQKLGFPTDDIFPELDDGKPKRNASADKEKIDSTKCPSCHTIMRTRPFYPCHHCNFSALEKTLEIAQGDLQKITRQKKSNSWIPEPTLETFRQLKGWAEEKGFKEGAAYHKYTEIFDKKPKWDWNSRESLPCPDNLKQLLTRMYLNRKRKAAYAARGLS